MSILDKVYEELKEVETKIENLEFTNRHLKTESEELKSETEDKELYIGQLEEQVESSEDTVCENNGVLKNLATKLGIIIVPDMPKWALLLEIERSIEKMKEK